MGGRVIGVGDDVAVFRSQFRVFDGDGAVHSHAVAVDVGRVVRQSAVGERQVIQTLRLLEKRRHEVSAAHVMDEIAEKLAAERIVAHVLYDAAAVSVGMSLKQIVVAGLPETAYAAAA